MKKSVVLVVLLVSFLLLFSGCGKSLTVGPFSSLYFNGDEYDAAVQEVLTAFSEYEGCTLKRIDYAGDKAVEEEAASRGLSPERVMVLTSTFSTDGGEHNTVFEPNHTYEGYKWILTRSLSSDSFWTILDRGYC